jgi:hypothetical protein
MIEQVAGIKRGVRAMEWTIYDRRQQMNNQPLMGVAKAGADTAVKANAVPAVNGVLCHLVDHGRSGKVGSDGMAVVDNRKQLQQQSGSNQLKVTVASSGIDSQGSGSKQWRSMAISSKTPTSKVIIVAPPTFLLLVVAGGGGQAAAEAAKK